MWDLLFRYLKHKAGTTGGFIFISVVVMVYFLFILPNYPYMFIGLFGLPLGAIFSYSAIKAVVQKK